MDDDSSNDLVIAMEEDSRPSHSEDDTEDRPIMQFLRRLFFNNSSQNTILTNAQLENILSKEFNYDIASLHYLEVDIYINVLKKFLKDWPKWDEFDRSVKETSFEDEEALKKVLETRYEHLKRFLKTNLDIVKPLSKEWVAKAKNDLKEKVDGSNQNVVLEIIATREQLTKLIYRCPNPAFENTIFNCQNILPGQIRLNTLSLEAILNWWSVRIVLSLQWVPNSISTFIKHETAHESDYRLVNKANDTAKDLVWLNDTVQIRESKKYRYVHTSDILGSLDVLSSVHPDYAVEGMETIIQFLKNNIAKLPFCIAQAEYKKYLNKHPYIRYLYTDVENHKKGDKYDIRLQETVKPMHKFSIGRVDGKIDTNLPNQWLRVECISCSVTFSGAHLASELREHFNEHHQVEPDWHCSNCWKSFPMAFLAENSWVHECKLQFGQTHDSSNDQKR